MGIVRQRPGALLYGGDYNAEQWPEEVWVEDVELMRRAHVNLVSVGIFSWALIEPEEGRYELDWLDRLLDLLHAGGISVDLATASASPPPWLAHRYPETLPVRADGTRLWPGGRQAYCPSSIRYRSAATRLAETIATRFATHPALALWHVNNEYGCHVSQCFCDASAAAFRDWLRARYGDLATLNHAWGTTFWSQRYGSWDEIQPPRTAPNFANPTQQLDYRRFSSDELLACFRLERDVLRRLTPDVPVTTNLMLARFAGADYWPWGAELDVVSNDHYILAEDPEREIDLALGADLTRGIAGGRPWLLMEHSPSAVNWQPRNLPKRPARCATAWRTSRAAPTERCSSSGAPPGPARRSSTPGWSPMPARTRVFAEVVALGADLERLGELAGSRVRADVAILWDWNSWWAVELDSHPSLDVRYLDAVRAVYRALWRAGTTVDLIHPDGDLGPYRLVLAPSLYLVGDGAAASIASFVAAGGDLLVCYFSGIVDDNDHIRLGGYPGAFRDVLGIRIEEFCPLPAGGTVTLSTGARGTRWSERMRADGAEVLATYADGDLAGLPAVTRNAHGAGRAWYVSTQLDDDALAGLLAEACTLAGVGPAVAGLPAGVEAVRRYADDAAFLFVLNHLERAVEVPARGHELLADAPVDGLLQVAAGGVAVVRETAAGA